MSDDDERRCAETSLDINDALRAVIDAIVPLLPEDEQSHIWNTALVMLVAELIVDCYDPGERLQATKVFCKALIRAVPITAKVRAEQAADERLQ